MMKRSDFEIMAPVGSYDSLAAAIQGGADSIYFGIEGLNMRSRSSNNFTIDDLHEIVRICNEHGIKSYLTVNTVIYDNDIELLHRIVDAAKEAGLTAIIASDVAAMTYAREVGVEVHLSTQLNISNTEALRFYARFADVVVLARELNLEQVARIHEAIERDHIVGPGGEPVRIEMFCHGALCMAVSGKCYLSLHEMNASANRGACMQICRRSYEVKDKETGEELEVDNAYIMSPKDLKTIHFLNKLIDAGVRVFKIEGRAFHRREDCRVGRAACHRLQPRFLERLLPGAAVGRVDPQLRVGGHPAQGLCRQGGEIFLQPGSGRVPARERDVERGRRDTHHRSYDRGALPQGRGDTGRLETGSDRCKGRPLLDAGRREDTTVGQIV